MSAPETKVAVLEELASEVAKREIELNEWAASTDKPSPEELRALNLQATIIGQMKQSATKFGESVLAEIEAAS